MAHELHDLMVIRKKINRIMLSGGVAGDLSRQADEHTGKVTQEVPVFIA